MCYKTKCNQFLLHGYFSAALLIQREIIRVVILPQPLMRTKTKAAFFETTAAEMELHSELFNLSYRQWTVLSAPYITKFLSWSRLCIFASVAANLELRAFLTILRSVSIGFKSTVRLEANHVSWKIPLWSKIRFRREIQTGQKRSICLPELRFNRTV